jgi:hypothetical protein
MLVYLRKPCVVYQTGIKPNSLVVSPFNMNVNDRASCANQFLNFWNCDQVI